jgi:hypothetical protein
MFFFKFLDQQLDLRNKKERAEFFKSKKWYEKLIILFINGFLVTPVCVSFWASSWDILWEILYPNDTEISLAISWIIAHTILFVSYLIQDHLQQFHDKLQKKFANCCFLNPAFLLRLFDLL